MSVFRGSVHCGDAYFDRTQKELLRYGHGDGRSLSRVAFGARASAVRLRNGKLFDLSAKAPTIAASENARI